MISRLLKYWNALGQHLLRYIGPFYGALLLFVAARSVLEYVGSIHFGFGLAAALLLIVLAEILRRGISKFMIVKATLRDILAMFFLIVLMAIAACSGASYLIERQVPGSYTIRSPYSVGTFSDYYFWLFVDLIPAIKVWETLGIPAPAKATNVTAGIPVLLFRVFILLGVISTYKQWRQFKKAQREPTNK
jgi:hypothetical protein